MEKLQFYLKTKDKVTITDLINDFSYTELLELMCDIMNQKKEKDASVEIAEYEAIAA